MIWMITAALANPAQDAGAHALALDFDRDAVHATADRVNARYKAACDAGWKPACDVTWSDLPGARPDAAREVMAPLCEAGDQAACLAVAFTESETNAAVRFGSACIAGLQRACVALGERHLRGEGTSKDAFSASRLFTDACPAAPIGCRYQGLLRMHGAHIDRDYEKAVAHFREGCDNGDMPACGYLGMLQTKGVGTGPDHVGGVANLNKACDNGAVDACLDLGHYLMQGGGSEQKAVAPYSAACQMGDAGACREAGFLKAEAGDDATARGLFLLGCESGDGRSCTNLGTLLDRLGQQQEALPHFEQGCTLENGKGCAEAAFRLIQGERGIKKDPARGIELAEAGCQLDDAWACHLVGAAWFKGVPGKRDYKRAATAFARACALGPDQHPCDMERRASSKAANQKP